MGLSICAYARHRGVSHVAVQKAIKAGRIATEPDGTIDPDKADAAWVSRSDPSQRRGKAAAPDPAPPVEPLRPVAEAAVGSVRDTLKENGLPAGGAVTFVQARTAHEIAKAHLARLRLQRMKGELVDRARAVALVFRLAREERDAWGNWPARIAAVMAAGWGWRRTRCRRSWKPMSAPISPISRSRALISADLLAFDGAEDLWRTWREGLTPDPALTVSQWADRHRILSPRASAEPGRYRTDRTPYMRAIMDALSPSHPARRVVFMKAAQVGATESGNCFIGYVIHHAPGPMLAVQPTVELAKRFSRQRIDPLIAESPVLRERVKPSRARDAGNTVLSKEFPAGLLVITGANSAVGLRSMPARYLFLDEVDAYPPSADEEGDPVALAEARTRTFSWRSKVFLASTPTIHGVSRIEREYAATDQRRFFVPCPHCGQRQWLRFDRLRWEKG
ncbi:MAG TPA: phage terminase large subunit family protein [Azospirillaceae bacterium]|nr:phage terminase large subunit family protein [Azospirillaceae bacterium]